MEAAASTAVAEAVASMEAVAAADIAAAAITETTFTISVADTAMDTEEVRLSPERS